MNSENSKTSEPHVLILKLADELDLTGGEKNVVLPNLSIYYTWKNIKKKSRTITINLINQPQHGMKILNYQMDHTLYQIFNIILSIF